MSKFGKFAIIALCCFSVNTFANDWDVDGNNEADALSDGMVVRVKHQKLLTKV